MRFQPKQWRTPRGWKGRRERAFDACGWSGPELQQRILRSLWPDSGEKPAWAELALGRHWMTLADYIKVPFLPGPTALERVYEKMPMFALVRKP